MIILVRGMSGRGVYLVIPADAEPTAERWSVAALAFGEIEDLAHTGPFDTQVHLLGPSLYLYSPDDDDRPRNRSGLAPEEWALCAGVLFGLTDASADATVRVMFAMEY